MGHFERILSPIFESAGEAPRAKLFHVPMFGGAKRVQLGFGTLASGLSLEFVRRTKFVSGGGWKSRGVVNSRINGSSLVIME